MTREGAVQLGALGALAVIFAHAAYGIPGMENFLGPLANYGGIAVDLFYFLSAYGLALSAAKNEIGALEFYRRRAAKIILPVWITLGLFFALDAIFLSRGYDLFYIVKSVLLCFPTFDLYADVNSPLWYITPLVIYYLAFPFFFRKGRAWMTALLFLMLGYFISIHTMMDHPFQVHYLAFPIGIIAAGYSASITRAFNALSKHARLIIGMLLFALVAVASVHSGAGTEWQQCGSVAAMLALAACFFAVPFRSKTLAYIGAYSFELYLLHWPLMSRFDFLSFLREWPYLWLIAWICMLLCIGLILQSICAKVRAKQVS